MLFKMKIYLQYDLKIIIIELITLNELINLEKQCIKSKIFVTVFTIEYAAFRIEINWGQHKRDMCYCSMETNWECSAKNKYITLPLD